MAYVPPQFAGKSFTCPHCDVYAQFWWLETKKEIWVGGRNVSRDTGLHIANCHHCSGRMVWFVDAGQPHVLYPSGISAAPLPHAEMPEDVKCDYVESREIVNASPRGAAALLFPARRAAGGAGIVVTEGASVHSSDWPYERAPLAERCAAGWQAIAAACQGSCRTPPTSPQAP